MERVTFSRSDLDDMVLNFAALSRRVPLGAIRNDEAYNTAVGAMNGLLEAGAGDENHPLAPLLDLLAEFISDYDSAHHQLPNVPPAEVLRLLMDQHGLNQADLPEVGSQGVVSEILNGKRDLNVGQIKRLAERFQISPATLL